MPKLKTYWFADISNQKRLSELLQDPCLSMALQVVREECRPKGGTVASDVLLQANAMENAQVYGGHKALDMLEALTVPQTKREKSEQDPFLESAKESLRLAGLEPPQPKTP